MAAGMNFEPDDEAFLGELGTEETGMYRVDWKPVRSATEFRKKADELLSNAMDLLNAKIKAEMAEASDIKTAVDLAKHFRVGIETVDEAAKKALAEVDSYEEIEAEPSDDIRESMRFTD